MSGATCFHSVRLARRVPLVRQRRAVSQVPASSIFAAKSVAFFLSSSVTPPLRPSLVTATAASAAAMSSLSFLCPLPQLRQSPLRLVWLLHDVLCLRGYRACGAKFRVFSPAPRPSLAAAKIKAKLSKQHNMARPPMLKKCDSYETLIVQCLGAFA
ncbi:hypothetical protein ERJ75_000641300 [Trypanosoma vivax]|nr:hypothetical protein ERJ75_000641300 [Trypanosoma vivax]